MVFCIIFFYVVFQNSLKFVYFCDFFNLLFDNFIFVFSVYNLYFLFYFLFSYFFIKKVHFYLHFIKK